MSQESSPSRDRSGDAFERSTNAEDEDAETTMQQQASSETLVSSKPKAGGGIDTHPFARGSVIEVLCRNKDAAEDDDDSSDCGDDAAVMEVRLADIIDRAPSNTPNHALPSHRWRYYVHYRDLNRRMDEWVENPLRIIGPPSVGNAKVRAIKKAKVAQDEQERRAREASAEERRRKRESVGSAPAPALTDTEDSAIDKKRIRSTEDSHVSDDLLSSSRHGSQRVSSRRSSSASLGVHGAADANVIPNVIPFDEELVMYDKMNTTARLRRKSSRAGNLSSSSSMVMDENVTASDSHSKVNADTPQVAHEQDEQEALQVRDKVVTLQYKELDEHEGLDEASLREHEEVTKVKNVAQVQIGPHIMDAWYFSPLPKELFKDTHNTTDNFNMLPNSTENTHGTANSSVILQTLFVCEFTLQFFGRKQELLRYQAKGAFMNQGRHPPGHEIYRAHTTQGHLLSMFEVDGYEEKIYCQNLCYIAKLFLDHKTLYYDVDPFLFYVLCEVDERGYHPVGYFSKEKYSDVGYNLACILTFPCHQRKGYGRFLISFSYELSKKEEKVGSPEKPMSDLGQQAYKPYWASVVVDFLLNQSFENSLSIMEISKRTSIMVEDIIFTLNMLGLLKCINDVYFISAERSLLQQLEKKYPIKEPRVDPSKLHWTPFITDVKRDKFSIHSKKPSVEESSYRASGSGGF